MRIVAACATSFSTSLFFGLDDARTKIAE